MSNVKHPTWDGQRPVPPEPALHDLPETATNGKPGEDVVSDHAHGLGLGAITLPHYLAQLERFADRSGDQAETRAHEQHQQILQMVVAHVLEERCEQTELRPDEPEAGADQQEAKVLA